MLKNALLTFILATVVGLGVTASAKADIIATIGVFDESSSPDFTGPFPTAIATLGNFSFVPVGFTIGSVTISGTFGNNDLAGFTNVTADSDYYIDGSAIQVATCDSPDPSNPSLSCDAGSSTGAPTPWSDTLTPAQIATITPLLDGGSLDFNVIQNYYGAVETGVITLDIAPAVSATPEPGTICIVSLGLAGVALLRRRKV